MGDRRGRRAARLSRRARGAAWLPLLALALGLALLALLAPPLAPYDPRLPSGPPLARPGAAHLLGTNDIGQDVLSEWLHGARATLLVAALVTALSTALSWTVGLVAGVWRRAEAPLMTLTDLLLALPGLPLVLLVVALVGPSLAAVVLTLAALSWPAFARIVRSQVLATRSAPYVEAARALGATGRHVALRHILPATLPLLPTKVVLSVRYAIFAEASLAFLGLGDPATRSWGGMLGWAFNYPLLFAHGAWAWWALPPAAAIAGVVLLTTWAVTRAEPAADRAPPAPGSSARAPGPRTIAPPPPAERQGPVPGADQLAGG